MNTEKQGRTTFFWLTPSGGFGFWKMGSVPVFD
jgi:hypothetical protein